jgi:ubiquinone/menaquinone biosynthesis C-methylase UbiE
LLETLRYIQLDLCRKRTNYLRNLALLWQEIEGLPLTNTLRFKFVQDNAEILNNFNDECVDLVVSKGLFEHIKNPEKAVKAIFRVLKPKGVTIHMIHLFTSITGGHNPEWYNFRKYEPWDHLRREKFLLPYGHLNKLTAKDYIRIFEKYFHYVHYEYIPARHFVKLSQLLTKEIMAEISKKYPNLSMDDLLNEVLIVIARKQ